MAKSNDIEREAQAILIYDNGHTLDAEFRNELERVLSSSLPVKLPDGYWLFHYSWTALPWLEIALIFASSTVATSVLSKIGEDVYGQFKRGVLQSIERKKKNKAVTDVKIKELEELKEKRSPDEPNRLLDYLLEKKQVTLTINANDILIEGSVISENYEGILEAIKSASQMVADASKKYEMGLDEILQDPNLYTELQNIAKSTPAFQPGLWFEYQYDSSEKQWEFKRITLYRPFKPNPGDQIIYIDGEPYKEM